MVVNFTSRMSLTNNYQWKLFLLRHCSCSDALLYIRRELLPRLIQDIQISVIIHNLTMNDVQMTHGVLTFEIFCRIIVEILLIIETKLYSCQDWTNKLTDLKMSSLLAGISIRWYFRLVYLIPRGKTLIRKSTSM